MAASYARRPGGRCRQVIGDSRTGPRRRAAGRDGAGPRDAVPLRSRWLRRPPRRTPTPRVRRAARRARPCCSTAPWARSSTAAACPQRASLDELVLEPSGASSAAIHREYIAAGADIIETDTFSANRVRLGQLGLADRTATPEPARRAAGTRGARGRRPRRAGGRLDRARQLAPARPRPPLRDRGGRGGRASSSKACSKAASTSS